MVGHCVILPASAGAIETISSHASNLFSKLENHNSRSGLLVLLILASPVDMILYPTRLGPYHLG